MVRKSAFAGHFYPGKREELLGELKKLVVQTEPKRKVLGLVSPHAGYIYSGSCAGRGYGRVEIPAQVVILGLSHHPSRLPLVVDGNDYWETPLGSVPVNHDLRFQLLGQTDVFQLDADTGRMEHSLEVQVPFIQYVNPKASILPIIVSTHRESLLLEAGRELGRLLEQNPDLLLVASSDMSHYVSAARARDLDKLAIDRMLELDAAGLLGTVLQNDISMCGVAPVAVMLEAARTAGAVHAEVICYTHSGEVTGDMNEVVAYLSLSVHK